MADEPDARERALRRLPLPYSLALRLRDAGVTADQVSEYIGIDEGALGGFYRLAEEKFVVAMNDD